MAWAQAITLPRSQGEVFLPCSQWIAGLWPQYNIRLCPQRVQRKLLGTSEGQENGGRVLGCELYLFCSSLNFCLSYYCLPALYYSPGPYFYLWGPSGIDMALQIVEQGMKYSCWHFHHFDLMSPHNWFQPYSHNLDVSLPQSVSYWSSLWYGWYLVQGRGPVKVQDHKGLSEAST